MRRDVSPDGSIKRLKIKLRPRRFHCPLSIPLPPCPSYSPRNAARSTRARERKGKKTGKKLWVGFDDSPDPPRGCDYGGNMMRIFELANFFQSTLVKTWLFQLGAKRYVFPAPLPLLVRSHSPTEIKVPRAYAFGNNFAATITLGAN